MPNNRTDVLETFEYKGWLIDIRENPDGHIAYEADRRVDRDEILATHFEFDHVEQAKLAACQHIDEFEVEQTKRILSDELRRQLEQEPDDA